MCSKEWRGELSYLTKEKLGVWGEKKIWKKKSSVKTADTQCTKSKTREKTSSTQSKQTHGSVATAKKQ